MSAAVLLTVAKQLALVTSLGQRAKDAGSSRLGMTAVLFEHERKLLSDELGTRHPALPRCAREQLIRLVIECDRRRPLPGKCHGSNMTRRRSRVNPEQPGVASGISRLRCTRTQALPPTQRSALRA